MKRHEKGDISCCDINVPELPVNKKGGSLARLRKKKVPDMRIAMDDRERPPISQTHPWLQ